MRSLTVIRLASKSRLSQFFRRKRASKRGAASKCESTASNEGELMRQKRKTKAQREVEQKAALSRRINDVYTGATGRIWSEDEFATAIDLSKIIPALQILLGDQMEHKYFWRNDHIDKFDTPETATDFLFGSGFRA